MSDKDIRYLKSLDTVANTYPPAKGFCDPESVAGTSADKVIISQNNVIIELLVQIQQLLAHSISTSTISASTLETLQTSFQALKVTHSTPKPPPRKFLIQEDPAELVKKYKQQNGIQ